LAAEYPGTIDATNPEIPLDEFAAAVAATDLLISVDTMAAHCAGALGLPVWIMVPYSPHWVLGGRTRSDALVSDGAAVPPGCSTGLVECRR
jgi:ADP-heptose:LPS heptosyltransferase